MQQMANKAPISCTNYMDICTNAIVMISGMYGCEGSQLQRSLKAKAQIRFSLKH